MIPVGRREQDQEPGARSQEQGNGSQEIGNSKQETILSSRVSSQANRKARQRVKSPAKAKRLAVPKQQMAKAAKRSQSSSPAANNPVITSPAIISPASSRTISDGPEKERPVARAVVREMQNPVSVKLVSRKINSRR